MSASDYDYEKGGLSYEDRVPKNLIGDMHKKERMNTDAINN